MHLIRSVSVPKIPGGIGQGRRFLEPRSMSIDDTEADSPDGVSCPTCDRNDFESPRGMKMHHAHAHGESISGVPVECESCGDAFRVRPGRKDEARWCSHECRKNRVDTSCDNCNTPLEVIEFEYQTHDHHFCDAECRRVWMAEYLSGEDSPLYKRVDVECHTCGADLTRYPWEIERSERFFCNSSCLGKWRETMTGESHPNWKGGRPKDYGPNWYQQRRKVKDRDSHNCRVCGMGEDQHESEFGERLHVHHIRPLLSFKENGDINYEIANSLSNLVTLCEGCHDKWEGIPLKPL